MRVGRLVTIGLVLAQCAVVHAEMFRLGFDFPLAQYPGTRFTLRTKTVVAGKPTQVERFLETLPQATCQGTPDTQRTPETLCGDVCLTPGEYTLSVFATRPGAKSPESNLLDLDATSTTPCPGTKPVTPPPPQKPPAGSKPPSGPVVAGGAAGAGAIAASQGSTSLTGMVNLQCVAWQMTGPCLCAPNVPCVTVAYWEPAWVVETVKKPGTTVIPVLGDLLATVLGAVGVPLFGGGGAGNATGAGHTNLHYTESHVYAFPQIYGGPCTGCAPAVSPFTLHYASELDPKWRIDTAVPSPLDLVRQVGVWGRLYPRSGKVVHGSESVASALAAVRALDVAFNPVGEPPNNEARVVLQPTGGTSSCCQMASPRATPCFPAGTPPFLWEHWTTSPTGSYLWVYWRRRSCCVNPAQSKCGIALIGGEGGNACIPSSTP